MEEIKLSPETGYRLLSVIDRTFKVSYHMNTSEETRRRTRLKAEGLVILDSLEARLHGDCLVGIVRCCFEYCFSLRIDGDVEAVLKYLIAQFVAGENMPESVAKQTVEELFPNGQFIHNKE